MQRRIKLLGAMCHNGQKQTGVELAPKVLKDMFDMNIELLPMNTDTSYRTLYETHSLYSLAHKVITIGGDHSISASTVASSSNIYNENLLVVWVDAHADLNTYDSSLTKSEHGMPVSKLLGIENTYNFHEITPKQIIYLGLRDVDEYEQNKLNELGIEHYTIQETKDNMTNILDNIIKRKNKIHISFDVDSLDPKYFPSTGTPVENGLTIEEGKQILQTLRPQTISVDFVEFNPSLTNEEQSNTDAKLLKELIEIML